ncbi:hypothetical protein KP79_PYT10193 [Mizuhopecten yessoensis]|uniref:Uncharacterized protein n=1 Tax=Mizuhopecten yessoensis TaxID=6573 RepID=A0A210Q500_MIZYE|nr:hypothetical protein KP79_PYT10193 [Mizuhopecten yessoensis]
MMGRRPTSGNLFYEVGLLVFASLRLVDAQLFLRALNPKQTIKLNQCREVCGDEYFDCKIGKCDGGEYVSEKGYGLCVDLCKDSFYSCLDDCKTRVTPVSTTPAERATLPPGVNEIIRNLHTAKDISEFNMKFLHGPNAQNQAQTDNTANAEPNVNIPMFAGKNYLNKLNTVRPFSFTGVRS